MKRMKRMKRMNGEWTPLYDRRRDRLLMENKTFLTKLRNTYGIDENNLNNLNCDIFNNSNDEFKKKYKKAFIESSKSGLYEYYAKEVECLDEAIQNNKRSLEAAGQNSTGYDREINQSYIFSNKKKYRRVRQLCTILASEFCAIKNENANSNYIVEQLKKISYKELGPRRRLKLMIRGYTYDGAQWDYTKNLRDKFTKASEICYNNKHCLDSASSLEDIPKDFRGFLGKISAAVEGPFNYLLDNINELTELRNTEKVKERIKRIKRIDNLTKKMEVNNTRGRLKRMVTKSQKGMKSEKEKIEEKLTKKKKMKELVNKKTQLNNERNAIQKQIKNAPNNKRSGFKKIFTPKHDNTRNWVQRRLTKSLPKRLRGKLKEAERKAKKTESQIIRTENKQQFIENIKDQQK